MAEETGLKTPLREETTGNSLLSRAGAALALGAIVLALAAAPALGANAAKKNPRWTDLSAEQHEILAPLGPEWNTLEVDRKSKWLGIAKRYPGMTPTEQERVQKRMQAWVKLSPEQRREARERHRRIEKIPPDQRGDLSERWKEYNALPPQERKAASEPRDAKPVRRRGSTPAPAPAPALAKPKPVDAGSAPSPAAPAPAAQ